jgi:nucleoside-triphosphatase THEP1
VDELGPTELQFGQGWIEAITLLREGDYRLALVVVRPTLLHEALPRFGHPITTVAWVTVANRESLFDLLKARLEGILAGEAKG